MSLKRNILANYLGMGATVLAPIIALPWYLSELGAKQYGLIGFIAMLHAILGLLNAGMAQAFIREVAVRYDVTDKGRYRTASLLYGFERIYWLFALCAGLVVALLADTIATRWLNLNGLSVATGREAVYGAAAMFVAQFPSFIYRGLLAGTQAQISLNSIVITGAFLRHVGGAAVVAVWPTLTAYLIWHFTISLLETLFLSRQAWGLLRTRRGEVKWDPNELRTVWPNVVRMSGAVLLGVLTIQIDRIVLSNMVSIEQFGYYTVAVTVALGALQLIYPVTQAVLPHSIQMNADPVTLRRLSIKLAKAIAFLVGLGAVTFIASGKWLLNVWLRSSEAVTAVYPILCVLLVGTALNAFYNVGYVNWLAQQKIQMVLWVNGLALVLASLLIPPLVSMHGTIGAAFGWLVINLIGFVFSLGWLKRQPNERSD